jgi:hypothetical protein
VVVDLSNYNDVRAEVARICVMLSAQIGVTETLESEFVISRVALR